MEVVVQYAALVWVESGWRMGNTWGRVYSFDRLSSFVNSPADGVGSRGLAGLLVHCPYAVVHLPPSKAGSL